MPKSAAVPTVPCPSVLWQGQDPSEQETSEVSLTECSLEGSACEQDTGEVSLTEHSMEGTT